MLNPENGNWENEFGQPVGRPVPDFIVPPRPQGVPLAGRTCRLVRLSVEEHAAALFEANREAPDGRNWTYLSYGPFETLLAYQAWMSSTCLGDDPLFYAVIDQQTDRAVGVASYLRIDPASSGIEVGHIHFSPLMQRTVMATEALYLMMAHVFDDLGYRRYEWKCNSLNAPSMAAARRLGFTYEGIFRQHMLSKGRNRDTAWFAAMDHEWPALRNAYTAWLSPENFDKAGMQKLRLADLTAAALKTRSNP